MSCWHANAGQIDRVYALQRIGIQCVHYCVVIEIEMRSYGFRSRTDSVVDWFNRPESSAFSPAAVFDASRKITNFIEREFITIFFLSFLSIEFVLSHSPAPAPEIIDAITLHVFRAHDCPPTTNVFVTVFQVFDVLGHFFYSQCVFPVILRNKNKNSSKTNRYIFIHINI